MSEKVLGSKVTVKENSVVLSSKDLFDKIINLRFHFNDEKGSTFTIRSDYEPVFAKNGAVYFKPCTYKPSIKLEMKCVSNSTGIGIVITVSNLFIQGAGYKDQSGIFFLNDENTAIDGSGGSAMYSSRYNVDRIEIQAGYRSQFPKWDSALRIGDAKSALEAFYALDNSYPPHEREDDSYQRPKTIVAQCLASYINGFPPEREYVFQCTVGSTSDGLDYQKTSDAILSSERYVNKKTSQMQVVLDNYISRRFVRNATDFKYKMKTKYYTMKECKKGEEIEYKEVELKTKSKIEEAMNNGSVSRTKYGVVIYKKDGKVQELELGEDGLMSENDAANYGVRIYLSDKLRSISLGKNFSDGGITAYTSLPQQLDCLQAVFSNLRYLYLIEGSIFFYDASETNLWEDDAFKYINAGKPILLPAIYDFDPKGLRTIKAPFVSWAGPGSIVVFSSRYGKGTFLSYFYQVETIAFSVILSTIRFSTTGDENEMEMSCTDRALSKEEEDSINEWLFGSDYNKKDSEGKKEEPPKEAVAEAKEEVELMKYGYVKAKAYINVKNDDAKIRGFITSSAKIWSKLVSAVKSFDSRVNNTSSKRSASSEMILKKLLVWNPEYAEGGSIWSARKHGGEVQDNMAGTLASCAGVNVCELEDKDSFDVFFPVVEDEEYYKNTTEYANESLTKVRVVEFASGLKSKEFELSRK